MVMAQKLGKSIVFFPLKCIDVRKGVLGGLTPPSPLRLKIWADPPPLENFRAGDPLKRLLGGLGGR